MWALYEKSELSPETTLTGVYAGKTAKANVGSVLDEITAAFEENQAKLERIREANEVD